MKRIQFIAPVEAMRGNLSGKQTLEYPLNGNPAYDAPAGKHYATNYQPRFIGAMRASDGLKYFAVKKRSAINKTAASTLAMAVLGGCGAIVGAILADKTSALYIAIENLFMETKPKRDGKEISLRAWLSESIMYGLRNKMDAFSWTGLERGVATNITVLNPFVKSEYQADYTVTISDDVLVKFWNALANNPVVFNIAGQTGVAHSNDLFSEIIASGYNVLGLSTKTTEAQGDVVVIGDMYLMKRLVSDPTRIGYVLPSESVEITNSEYYLSNDAPTA